MALTAVLSEVERDQVLDTESYTAPPDAGMTAQGIFISLDKALPAVPAQCGDTLRLRVSMTGIDGGFLDEITPTPFTVP
jgi:hypothetical protein